ncbi:MAG: hypothetical protein ACREHG_06630 [Candidatus Saccharimonadales bacterium]
MSEQIVVSESMLESLQGTRPWVKFLAILGFVISGIAVIAGLFFWSKFSHFPITPGQPAMPRFLGPAFGIFYILMAIFFYVIPCLYLLRYGSAITRIPESGQAALEEALQQQKRFWKYMGIFAIVVLALYLLFFIGGIAIAIIVAAMHHPG